MLKDSFLFDDENDAGAIAYRAQFSTNPNFDSGVTPEPFAITNIPGEINVTPLGGEFTGQGVRVGIIDNGFDVFHSDLAAAFNTSLDYDFVRNDFDSRPEFAGDNHGTAVAGVIGAQPGGLSTLGVAYGAELVGYKVNFDGIGDVNQFVNALNAGVNVDVLNNSWGFVSAFYDDFSQSYMSGYRNALINNVDNGRGGLGTNVVFAAGNDGDIGGNVNYHNMINSPFTIAVGATQQNGEAAYFTTPGAALLVSAPGYEVVSTDRTGADGYTSGDTVTISGTSFAAPTISGVVALMLEANPNLGYRDVQKILAYTALKTDPTDSGWQTNGSDDSNGGGLHFNHLFGFGEVDANAAVRLAEGWLDQNTYDNLLVLQTSTINVGTAIPDGSTGGLTYNFTITQDFNIEHVLVDLDITHTWQGDLRVTLTSPDGTESVLIDRPGVYSGNTFGSSADNINFETVSLAHYGESSLGTWSLKVTDNATLDTGTWNNFKVSFLGHTDTINDTYIFTDEFANAAFKGINETDGGIDTIQLAAMTGDSVVDLSGVITNRFGGIGASIDVTQFENVVGGWGDDELIGNEKDNILIGGRGTDTIDGRDGNDTTVLDYNLADAVWTVVENTVHFTWQGIQDAISNVENFIFNDVIKTIDYFIPPAPNLFNPVANDERVVAADGQALTFDPLANDTDGDGDTLSISQLGTATNGTVSLNPDGTVTYTPTPGFWGVDSFTYKVSDGRGKESEEAIATVIVEQNLPDKDVNLSTAFVSNYAPDQAWNVPINISGSELTVSGNNWKKHSFDYQITDWTQMEVEVRINAIGEIQGIGFDRDDSWSNGNGKIFQFAGTQSYHKFVEDFRLDTDNGEGMGSWVKVVIPVGMYFNGDINHVTFINDHDDGAQNGSASYRNIRFYEEEPVFTTGDDKILGHDGENLLRGGEGNDRLYGGEDDDTLIGEEGDDYLHGGNGNDTLYGFEGNDLMRGADGVDFMYGGDGNDNLQGGEGNDRLFGEDGDDILKGEGGADRLSGGAGNDILVLDINDSNIDGGSGFDELRAEGGTVGQVIDLSNTRIEQIEFIDVGRNTAQDEIILTEADVLRVSDDDIIRIIGDAGDLVTATGFTTRDVDINENGVDYAQFIGSNGSKLYVELDGIIMNGAEVV